MLYEVEYNGKDCYSAYGRKNVLKWLKILKDETITDIRKTYRNGTIVSVLDAYQEDIRKSRR